jgi:LacI family repressor for deo operon, udp, cdd, tsx, nupC, and nupG
MTTLKDVAERAGVSVRTVSNVVNDWPHVRPAMRAKVKKVIEELGYEPNLAARNLRSGRSGLIALVVPEVDVPYFAELTRCIVDEFSARGMTVVVEQTDGQLTRERELMNRGAKGSLFDGVIFSPVEMSSQEIEDRRSTVPLVLLGEQHTSVLDHVLVDNIAAAQEATQHLVDLGRRRIALIGDRPAVRLNTSMLRTEGYKAALRSAGITPDPALMPTTSKFHRADGAAAMQELLALPTRPDAVFCLNDLLALGAMRTILKAGLRIPEDIAVVGFDGIEEGRYSTPTLTTVAPDKATIARKAVELLVAQIDGADVASHIEMVPYRIELGESTLGATKL